MPDGWRLLRETGLGWESWRVAGPIGTGGTAGMILSRVCRDPVEAVAEAWLLAQPLDVPEA